MSIFYLLKNMVTLNEYKIIEKLKIEVKKIRIV
jgi:hypothetical protein